MIQGWYYLHTNKELIYKNNPDAIGDIRDSDFCHSAWGWDGQRPTAWQILVEANSLGAKKERIKELAEKWGCNDVDAENYAKYLGIEIGMDGNACFARKADFQDLQQSPCGFGDTFLDAMSDLAEQLGYVGGKMWNATFKDVVSANKTQVKNGGFSAEIEKYTAANSNFQPERNYISLSHIHLSVEEIINQFKGGFEDTIPVRLKCYKGYQMERDLMERIKAVFGARIETGIEISAFGGLVKGHPDFAFDNYPSDCKSVLMDDWFPKDGKLPRRIYWQMQAYMKYSGKDKALVIFESRESGKLIDYWVRANWNIQNEIEQKLQQIVKAVS